MGTGVPRLALYLWVLVVVRAGVIRQLPEEQEHEDDMPCRTYAESGLVYLDCSDRGLIDLPDEIEYDAQVLLLSNNNFVTFPEKLDKFKKVESLDLSNNHLNQPLPTYLEKWTSLSMLNLSNNNYGTWVSDGRRYNIKRLDLSRNKINSIEDDAFKGMPNLHYLDLSENRIYDLPPKVFAEVTNLDSLYLCRNYFSDVPRFQSRSLRVLELSNCQITNIDVNSLAGMTSLLEISLAINQIESIPDNLASSTLQELDLSFNSISSLTDNTFSSLPHLAVLDLRGNEFRDVWSTSHFASNPFLREVHVKGNRWNCEGFSVNLLLMYEFLTKDPPRIRDRGSLICYSPSNVTQLSWQQAYIRTWHPNDSIIESYTTIAVMIGIIIGICFTSFICRALLAINRPDRPRSVEESTVVNLNGTIPESRGESVVRRVPLREEDSPPTYDEALLMPRLDASFHSLPDFVDVVEEPARQYRRSRSIGDLVDSRHRANDRRSVRRTVEIRIT